MGIRSKLRFILIALIVFSTATSASTGQELGSVLKSDTDDLRALIDLEPADSDIEQSDSSAAESSPQETAATDEEPQIQSVLKDSRVVNDSQVKSASFDREPKQQPSRPESLNKPAPLPAPTQNSPTKPNKAAANLTPSNIDDALFNFGVLVAGEQGSPLVRGVIVGSPAARAGIMAGDRIKNVGSTPIASKQQLATSLHGNNGRTLVRADRRGRERVFRVNLAESRSAAIPSLVTQPMPRSAPVLDDGWRASTGRAQAAATPTPATGLVPTPSQTGLTSRIAPAIRSVLDQLAGPTIAAAPTDIGRQLTTSSDAESALSDVPPPTPQPAASTGAQPNTQSTIRQQVLRVTPKQDNAEQDRAQPRLVQQSPVFRGQDGPAMQPIRRRPVIGDGGRMIGNGRVINSFRRIIGR